jgi:hypothetical protein
VCVAAAHATQPILLQLPNICTTATARPLPLCFHQHNIAALQDSPPENTNVILTTATQLALYTPLCLIPPVWRVLVICRGLCTSADCMHSVAAPSNRCCQQHTSKMRLKTAQVVPLPKKIHAVLRPMCGHARTCRTLAVSGWQAGNHTQLHSPLVHAKPAENARKQSQEGSGTYICGSADVCCLDSPARVHMSHNPRTG